MVIALTCLTMETTEQVMMGGDHLHPLLHVVLVVVWVFQFSSLAHVKLTYLRVLMNLVDTGMEHHQGLLWLFPVKMLAS